MLYIIVYLILVFDKYLRSFLYIHGQKRAVTWIFHK